MIKPDALPSEDNISSDVLHRALDDFSIRDLLNTAKNFAQLPSDFPNSAQTPRFLYGDKLRWITESRSLDWGTVIGRFYGFVPHLCIWAWCYVIWLDKNASSSGWTVADTVWEENLEPVNTVFPKRPSAENIN